jgi:hypothetical protein
MLSEKAIETLPKEVRDVCVRVEENCESLKWNSSHLLSNILFLRFSFEFLNSLLDYST